MARHIQAVFSVTVDSWQDLVVVAVDGVESLGRPYDFWITAVAPTGASFDAREAIGEKATLTFRLEGEGEPTIDKRIVRGVVTAIEDSFDLPANHRVYRFRLQPPIALLENIVSQELYVGTPIPDVIASKLTQGNIDLPHAFSLADRAVYVDGTDAAKWTDAPGTGQPSEPRLITQFKESDLAFVMRLAEHAGISMCFEGTEGGDKALFVDHNEGFPAAAGAIPYQGDGTQEGIVSLKRQTRWVPTIVMVADYNYRAPTANLLDGAGSQVFDVLGAKAESKRPWPGLVVDYAPNVKNDKEAKRQALIGKELYETECDKLEGQGHIPEMAAGLRFKIANHGTISEQDWHVAVAVQHHYESPHQGPNECGAEPQFRCTFHAVPLLKDDHAFTVRPQRRTPKPRIHGFVTGVIVGPSASSNSELQHIDSVGRYLVHLHFAQGETTVLPRIRMAQSHAGPNYGIHFPLRPGTEVLVAFVDGDPDRPLIVGAVPNAITRTPVFADGAAATVDTVVEPNRILSRSGILIEISDGDPPAPTP
ncbi:MAG: type VI secretion system tip protein VgrG [Myxococcales bacterium]|nr:type VI secretion system tip protein VgrG [Myxococcales bacterium]